MCCLKVHVYTTLLLSLTIPTSGNCPLDSITFALRCGSLYCLKNKLTAAVMQGKKGEKILLSLTRSSQMNNLHTHSPWKRHSSQRLGHAAYKEKDNFLNMSALLPRHDGLEKFICWKVESRGDFIARARESHDSPAWLHYLIHDLYQLTDYRYIHWSAFRSLPFC